MVNAAALAVLLGIDLRRFLLGDRSVSHGLVLHVLHFGLAFSQTRLLGLIDLSPKRHADAAGPFFASDLPGGVCACALTKVDPVVKTIMQ